MTTPAPLDPSDFRRLPEPVDLDATVTSVDVTDVVPEPEDGQRENAWLLRNAAG